MLNKNENCNFSFEIELDNSEVEEESNFQKYISKTFKEDAQYNPKFDLSPKKKLKDVSTNPSPINLYTNNNLGLLSQEKTFKNLTSESESDYSKSKKSKNLHHIQEHVNFNSEEETTKKNSNLNGRMEIPRDNKKHRTLKIINHKLAIDKLKYKICKGSRKTSSKKIPVSNINDLRRNSIMNFMTRNLVINMKDENLELN